MDRQELYEEIGMSYDKLVNHLLSKYGPAKADYFRTPTCKSKNPKTPRTNEGLLCHHIDEDKGGNLSHSESAARQPFEWQQAHRLIYCNYLEHLLLHLKIDILRQKYPLRHPCEIDSFFTTHGYGQITGQISDMYHGVGLEKLWRKRCFEEIKDNYYEYLLILKLTIYYLDKHYIGQRQPSVLKVGHVFAEGQYEITSIPPSLNYVQLKGPDGKHTKIRISYLYKLPSYDDMVQCVKCDMAREYMPSESPIIYDDILSQLSEPPSPAIKVLYRRLLVDYHGFGFPQFSSKFIDREKWGSVTVDEYISKAFPASTETFYHIGNALPTFWQGDIPPAAKKSPFYIVRIKSVFEIKQGETAFVRNKVDYSRRNNVEHKIDNDNNLLYKRGIIVSHSYMWDWRRQRYFSEYLDDFGNVHPSALTVTFTKSDFELFLERHNVSQLTILDGCYFQ